jgi:hypothetical protein
MEVTDYPCGGTCASSGPVLDARYAADLGERAGAAHSLRQGPDLECRRPTAAPCTDRPAEAEILRDADGCTGVPVLVRAGRRRLALDGPATAPQAMKYAKGSARPAPSYPVLQHATTWVLPDLELLRAGLIDADRLHPRSVVRLNPIAPGRFAVNAHNDDSPWGPTAECLLATPAAKEAEKVRFLICRLVCVCGGPANERY